MRLFHHPISSNSRRVLLAAELLGTPLDLVEVNLMSEADRSRLLEINPNAKIPVLDDDGFLLWESCAIMQYLADQTPGQQLYPHDPKARADVNRWMFWACQHFAPAVGVLTWERLWKGRVGFGGPDRQEEARGTREVLACGAVLDQHLRTRPYLVGEQLSLADIAVAAPLMYLQPAALPLDGHAAIVRWFGEIATLDAWKHTEIALD